MNDGDTVTLTLRIVSPDGGRVIDQTRQELNDLARASQDAAVKQKGGAEAATAAYHNEMAELQRLRREIEQAVGVSRQQEAQARADAAAQRQLAAELQKQAAEQRLAAETARAQTAGLRAQAVAAKATAVAAGDTGDKVKDLGDAHKHAAAHGHSFVDMLKQMTTGMVAMSLLMAPVAAGMAAIGAAKFGIEFRSQLETAELGIGSIVSAFNDVTDAQGRALQGADKLAAAQQAAGGVVEQLRKDAIETTATLPQLVEAFQAVVGPASAAKVSLDDSRKIAVAIVQTMGALGIEMSQARQEAASILGGYISADSRLAMTLGITNAMVRNWKEQGKLAENLLKTMDAFVVAGKKAGETWLGVTSTLQDAFGAIMGAATSGAFETLKREAKALADIFGSSDAQDKARLYGAALNDGLNVALATAKLIAVTLEGASSGWAKLWAAAKAPSAAIMSRATGGMVYDKLTGDLVMTPQQERILAGEASGTVPPNRLRREQIPGFTTDIGAFRADLDKRDLSLVQKQALMKILGVAVQQHDIEFGRSIGEISDSDARRLFAEAMNNYYAPPGGGGATLKPKAPPPPPAADTEDLLDNIRRFTRGQQEERSLLGLEGLAKERQQLRIELDRSLEEVDRFREEARQKLKGAELKDALGNLVLAERSARETYRGKMALMALAKADATARVFAPFFDLMRPDSQEEREAAAMAKFRATARVFGPMLGMFAPKSPEERAEEDDAALRRSVETALKVSQIRQEGEFAAAKILEDAAAHANDPGLREDLERRAAGLRLEGVVRAAQAERELRTRAAEDVGRLQMEFAVSAARMAAGAIGKAIKGEKLGRADIGGFVGGLLDTAIGAVVGGALGIPGGPAGILGGASAGAGVGSQIGLFKEVARSWGEKLDKQQALEGQVADAQMVAAGSLEGSAAGLQEAAAALQTMADSFMDTRDRVTGRAFDTALQLGAQGKLSPALAGFLAKTPIGKGLGITGDTTTLTPEQIAEFRFWREAQPDSDWLGKHAGEGWASIPEGSGNQSRKTQSWLFGTRTDEGGSTEIPAYQEPMLKSEPAQAVPGQGAPDQNTYVAPTPVPDPNTVRPGTDTLAGNVPYLDSGYLMALLEATREGTRLLAGLRDGDRRLTPGTTPQNPVYTQVVNFADLAAYIPQGYLYGGGTSTTSRGATPGSSRRINLGRRAQAGAATG